MLSPQQNEESMNEKERKNIAKKLYQKSITFFNKPKISIFLCKKKTCSFNTKILPKSFFYFKKFYCNATQFQRVILNMKRK